VHLRGSSLRVPVKCSSCHEVPRSRDEPGHIDSARPAEVVFDELASGRLRDPSTQLVVSYDPASKTCRNVYCHSRPKGGVGVVWRWTERLSGGLHCASCHKGKPHYPLEYCKVCHPAAYKDGELNPATHINGSLDFY
jgi:predicted CxxxxCH...CXXCH cytochrome family protein